MSSDSNPAGNGARSGKANAKRRGKPQRRSVGGTFGKGAYVENSAVLHQGRILAMQALFEADTTDHDLDEIIARIHFGDAELPESARETTDEDETAVDEVPRDVAVHAESLARGTREHLSEIDPIIEKAAPAYPIPQIAAIDRNVLRLAVYEFLHQEHVPVPVIINEAVEIAKRFGGDNSSKFVNGVLGTIGRQLPKERLQL